MDAIKSAIDSMMAGRLRSYEEIIEALRTGAEGGGFDRILFHGSGETIEGDLYPGGYDEVFWTSSSPAIAQIYIPQSGGKVMFNLPLSYEMRERVRPSENGIAYKIACEIHGGPITDVEWDYLGQATSWAVPAGWPTHQAVVDHLRDIGYDLDRDPWLLMNGDRIMPADYRCPGTLFALDGAGLRLKDLRRSSEGDLMDVEHHDTDAFRRAEADGWDGVVINDFAQSDDGNYGHVSFGLFADAIGRLSPIAIPCVRATPAELAGDRSDALREWIAEQPAATLRRSMSPSF